LTPDRPARPLDGRVILVTGAGRGIGRGIAHAAAARGAQLLVTALTAGEAETVTREIASRGGVARGCACDVTQDAAVAAAVSVAIAGFGRLDAVVHSATGATSARQEEVDVVDDALWEDQVAVAMRGLFLLARHARAALERSGGSLLVLTSRAAYQGAARQPAYAAVKGAQRGFVKALAREWGPAGIRVNALSPSAMTPALETYLAADPAARTGLVERAALRRFGEAEADIGAAACLLVGPDAGFVTGQTLVVDGGALMP
jgi:3-oxoacyl-[acyl-carrier protein] reductase